MEGTLHNLAIGFAHVFEPLNLLVLVVGIVLDSWSRCCRADAGDGVVLALPFTYNMHVIPAIILLTAMYVSGTYAGAWTSILFRVPGEPIDVPLLWTATPWRAKVKPPMRWLDAGVGADRRPGGGNRHGIARATYRQDRIDVFHAGILCHPVLRLVSVVSLGGASLANALISLFAGLLIAPSASTTPTARTVHLRRAAARGRHHYLV